MKLKKFLSIGVFELTSTFLGRVSVEFDRLSHLKVVSKFDNFLWMCNILNLVCLSSCLSVCFFVQVISFEQLELGTSLWANRSL